MMLSISTAIPFIALISYGALLAVAMLKGPRDRANRAFHLYLVSMSIWSFGSFMMHAGFPIASPLFWNKFMAVAGTAMPLVFFNFVRVFLDIQGQKRWLHIGLVSYVVLLIAYAMGYVVTEAYVSNGVLCLEYGAALPITVVNWLFFIGLSISNLIRSYRRTRDGIYRNKLKYLILGVGTIVLGMFTNLTPLAKYPVDIGANSVNAFLIAYAILRYQLLDITLVVRKGLLYSIPTAIIGTAYFLLISLAVRLLHTLAGPEILLISLFVAGITAVVAQPLRNKAQLWIDKRFFHEKYDSSRMLQRLSRTAASILDLDRLTGMIVDEVTTTMHIERAAFFLKQDESGEFRLTAQRGLDRNAGLRLRKDHPIVEWLSGHEYALTRHGVDVMPQFKALWGREWEDLERMEAELFIPLRARGELVGIFAIGPKLSQETYSQDDQLTLTTLANQTAVAIENARLYEASQRELAERKRAEEALRESEEEYRTLTEEAPIGLCNVDIKGRVTYVNKRFEEVSGCSREEVVGKNGFKLGMFSEETLELLAERMKSRLRGEPAHRLETRFKCKDGRWIWVEIEGRVIKKQGVPVGLQIASRNITGRKRAEEELRWERDLAEALEETTAVLTATLDFEQVLDRILEQVSRVVPNDATNIMLIEGDQARVVRWRGYGRFGEKEFVSAVVFRIPEVATLQRMLDSKEPIVIPDTATCPSWVPVPVQEWLRSYAAAPIVVRGEVIGFLNVDSATPAFFTQAHAEALRAFADHAAAAIENARLYEAEQERRHIAETLRQASTVLNSTLELDEVLRLILQQLRQVIPYDSASIQRLQGDALSPSKGERLEIVACQAFEKPDKVVGLVFPLDPQFPNHRVVTTEAPLAIEDVAQDYPHFKDEADTYKSGRIRSWLGVPLMVKDQIIGMIALDRAEVRPYTAEEAQLAMAFANQAAIAIENARLYAAAQQELTERKRAEEQIKASLKEKELLLKEIHHRVRNNLQVVSSLLDFQSEYITDQQALEVFKESQNRVRSMALVHEQLYQSEGLARIDFAEYVQNLAAHLFRSYGVNWDAITLKINADDVLLGVDTAIPCGLIISELVSNSLRHAFPGGRACSERSESKGEIRIDLHSDDDKLTLIVSDNGVGFPEDLDFPNTETLGLRLVNMLTRQLKGTIELDRSGGTAFKITFAKPKP